MVDFLIARNPDRASSLPYLLYLPIDGGLWLKVKETWPRSTRVYCHPSEMPNAGALDIIEQVPVVACTRRGPAIDLVLRRATNKRSQFVFTTFRGRTMILWQTPKAAAAARPGVRIPSARASAMESIIIDTRERYGFRFASHSISLIRQALPAGDYAIAVDGQIIASVERKTIDGLANGLSEGSLNFAMAELSTLASAAVVVEGTYSAILRHAYSRAGYMADLLARLHVRYPRVPIVFAESRKLAEEWTFRFLRAARAHAFGEQMELAPVPASPSQEARDSSRPHARKKRRVPK